MTEILWAFCLTHWPIRNATVMYICNSQTHIMDKHILRTSRGMALRWMPQDLTDYWSKLAQVIARVVNQCWPRSLKDCCYRSCFNWKTLVIIYDCNNFWTSTLLTYLEQKANAIMICPKCCKSKKKRYSVFIWCVFASLFGLLSWFIASLLYCT